MTALSIFSGSSLTRRMRVTFVVAAALVVAFFISLLARAEGSYYLPLDGWGVDLFELAMGGLCLRRYFESSWRHSDSSAKALPLVLGAACILWALGDVASTFESFGGATPPVPSVADGFFVGFFPLCYLSFMMLVRRGNNGSLVMTSLDGLVAGLGVASLSAVYAFDAVLRATGGGALAAATSMVYPLGDLLLLALAIGGMAVLPRAYRPFLAIASVAMAVNAVGDAFNLLQPDSKFGYVTNGVVWPISLLMLAIAVWVHPAEVERTAKDKHAGYTLPLLGALASMVILFDAAIGHVSRAAVGLATGTLLVASVRLALTVREAEALKTARFGSLIDNAWDIIVVAEADLEIAYLTPSSERVLGYAPEDLYGKPITDLVHPDDSDGFVGAIHALDGGATETAAFETRMRHRLGAWRTIAWTATNLLDDLSVAGYVLNGGDVTEARQAAEDLAAARDGALMASKAKSDFLSTMSHEIRTPMNGVIGLTELLLATNLDVDQLELASGVKVSAENLLVIINDILDFSKIEAGQLDIEEAAFSVPGVVDDVGRILARSAHDKGIELLIDVAPDVPTALIGDHVRIQQVLLNLGSNAVKFTFEGEVIIRVALLHDNLERVALRFDVIDMGIGIAEEDQKRLFRAFAQADSSTTRRFGGTGLGLAICRQLVELMGGELGVVSAPGEGSTFWFELSLPRAEAVATPESGPDALELAGLRALVVDDNATNRRILRGQLASWGIEADEAVDGVSALATAKAASGDGRGFDFGVVDMNMPGMDGVELARVLKSDPATAGITLLLLSSSGQRLGAGESHLRGFAASLTKPVRSSELFDSIVTSLRHGTVATGPQPGERHLPANSETMGMILLVEDNSMNQLVGSKVLSKLGFSFDIASNGREAVDAVRVGTYDAVLMDCQMPEMDGYEATGEIRRLEGASRHTPIIAMTAAAMEGDRETCLAAGMDDYITKPVRIEAVAEVLERWLSGGGAVAGGISDAERFGEDEPLDRTQIEALRSLDDGAGAVLSEIIDQYLAQAEAGRGDLGRGVSGVDGVALARTAHMLKGANANIGASGLASICARIENLATAPAEGPGSSSAAGLIAEFDAEFARVRDALTLLMIAS